MARNMVKMEDEHYGSTPRSTYGVGLEVGDKVLTLRNALKKKKKGRLSR